jgi:Tol biopolymer transport system component/DNA-binding winged helix-turn-helix (wHTH) protein
MGPTNTFRIGNCLIQPADFSIHFDNGCIQALQPKYMEVLVYLALHYPRVIPRKELIDKIWNNNSYVGEKALTNTIWHLRQNLIDLTVQDSEGNKTGSQDETNVTEVIKTIRKGGYQLLIQPIWQSDFNLINTNKNDDFAEAANGVPPLNKDKYQKRHFVIVIAVALVMVSTTLWFTHFSGSAGRPVMTEIERITRDPGSEIHPSASPNGQYLVYAWERPDGQTNMYMVDLTQPQLRARQLTFDDAEQSISVWSNDGQFLYFSRRNRAESICDIVEMKVTTNQERQVANCPSVGGYNYLDISPDDTQLAFRGYDASTGNTGIYIVDLTTENAKPVRFSCNIDCGYKDRDIAFSPDGKSLAISRRNYWYSEDILLIDILSGEEQTLVTNEEDIVGLAWHPDGKHLIYAAQRADIKRGHIINIDTKQSQSLSIEGFSYPSFAKNTGELFYQYQNERYYITKLQIDKDAMSSPFPVIESEFSHLYPDYSAPANAIVYVSNESGYYELWIADDKGMNRQQLTFLKQSVNYPRWSRKGDKVAFLAPIENTNTDKIHIIDVKSKKVTTVDTAFKLHNRPTWNWNDSAVISAVYTDKFIDLFEISIADGSSTRLTFDGGRYGIMTSPTTLLYTRRESGLWQKELEGDTFLKLSGEIFNERFSWVYANNAIYFSTNKIDHQLHLRYDFAQQSLVELSRLPLNKVSGYQEISINLNKQELLFTSGKSAQSDIKKLIHPLL